jgi:glycosyltransferase involved in cell wall biosynthesis
MRVLFYVRGNPYCGGQGIYLYHLTRELAKLASRWMLLVGAYPDPMDGWATVYRIENLNLWYERTMRLPYEKLTRIYSPWNFVDYFLTRFHVFPEMETFSLRAFFRMKELLRYRKYDIVHDVQCLGWGLLPMKAYGMPIVSTVHHPLTMDREADFLIDRGFWELATTVLFYPLSMQRIVIKRLDRVITSSNEGVGTLGKAFGLPADRLSVVYNGMDVETFRNTGEPRKEKTLLFVGNTEDHKKGMRYLFEALAMLPEDVTLTIVDEGPPGRLTAWGMIQELGLERRVVFTGKVDLPTLVSLYSTCTVAVMASLHEGFGLPAAEAMCMQTPVSPNAGALPEFVGDDGAGYWSRRKTRPPIRDAVESSCDSGASKLHVEKKAASAEENFAWPVAARNTLAWYRT